jgi:hypothetical protein
MACFVIFHRLTLMPVNHHYMSYMLEQPEIYDQPILLSDTEKQDPYEVIKEMFVDTKLCELRDFLRDIAETCLTTDRHPFSEPEKRSDFLFFKAQIEKCLEAVFIINLSRKA